MSLHEVSFAVPDSYAISGHEHHSKQSQGPHRATPIESQSPLPDTHDDFTGMAWNRHEFQGAGVGSNELPSLAEWHRKHQDAQVP